MEKKIENLKKEILKVLEQDATIGQIQFDCFNVEISVCIEIVKWCKEIGLQTRISLNKSDDLINSYASIRIKNDLFENVNSVLFTEDFGANVEFYNHLIDEHSQILTVLKQNKKSITSGFAKGEKKLIELSKSNKQ